MPSAEAKRKQLESLPVQHGQEAVESVSLSDLFTWQRWAVLVGCGMLFIALRTPLDWLHPTFYAEDGMIFFREQFLEGSRVIFRPYSGYFHLIPRLATLAASVAPIRDQPFLFSLFNVVIQSLCASFFFLPENRIFVRSDALRIVVCLLAVVDFQGDQMLNNVMDVQWFLFPVAILMLCHLVFRETPFSRNRVIVYSVLMLAICLTAPLLMFAIPLAILVLIRARGIERFVPVSMLCGLAVQAIAFAKTSVTPPTPPSSAPALFLALRPWVATMGAWVYRDLYTVVFGERTAKLLASIGGETLAALTLAAVVFAVAYLAQKLEPRQRILLLCAIVTSVGLVGTSLVVRKMLDFFGDLTHYDFFGGGARYFLISGWILLVIGAMTIETLCKRLPEFGKTSLLVAVFALGALGNFAVAELPNENWSASAPAMEIWRIRRDSHQPAPHVNAPIYPSPWSVYLPDL